MERLTLTPIQIDPKTFLSEHCRLPALPKVLIQFQEVMQSEVMSIRRVADIISRDAGLVAEVLKVVNSAYFSLPREVSRIDMAVAYLGIQEVHHIVLASSVIKTFNVSEPVLFKKIWHHSLYTSLCTRYLAGQFEKHLPLGELWAPSLLHDIGKLVYLKFFPEHFKALHRFAEEQGCLFSEATARHDLPSSAYLGSLLCRRWRLPGKIAAVCSSEEAEVLAALRAGDELPVLVRIIRLADLAVVLSTDRLQREKQLFFSDTFMQALDLTESGFLVLMGAISDLQLEADRLAA